MPVASVGPIRAEQGYPNVAEELLAMRLGTSPRRSRRAPKWSQSYPTSVQSLLRLPSFRQSCQHLANTWRESTENGRFGANSWPTSEVGAKRVGPDICGQDDFEMYVCGGGSLAGGGGYISASVGQKTWPRLGHSRPMAGVAPRCGRHLGPPTHGPSARPESWRPKYIGPRISGQRLSSFQRPSAWRSEPVEISGALFAVPFRRLHEGSLQSSRAPHIQQEPRFGPAAHLRNSFVDFGLRAGFLRLYSAGFCPLIEASSWERGR